MVEPTLAGDTADRLAQAYPILTAAQMETATRFASGPQRRFDAGEKLYGIGDREVPSWLILEGSIDITHRDGPQHDVDLNTHEAGQISGELSQLSGAPSLAAAQAGANGAVALPFDAAHLRALMIGSANVGEIVMRALILRRVRLIAASGSGSVLVGEPGDPLLRRIEQFLTRTGYETSRVTNFIAEVPSQLNEILLARHMAATATDGRDKLFYLLQLIELWVGHFLTVGIVAEFQDGIHAPVERGGALTGAGLSAEYLRILRAYYGSAVSVDALYGVGWARNYQLWGGYYSFQYATCITAAGVFADALARREPGARDRYLNLLRSGGSGHAYELIRDAGVDLASPAPYRQAVASIDALIDEATRLII